MIAHAEPLTTEVPPSKGRINRRLIALVALSVLTACAGIVVGSYWQPAPAKSVQPPANVLAKLDLMTSGSQAEIIRDGNSAQEINSLIPVSKLPLNRVLSFRAIDPSHSDYPTALKCLSQAIYYEAANESLAGKRSVAQVVLNRVRHPAYPNTICGVVYEGWDRPVCQFSFVCDGSLLRQAAGPQWRESTAVAKAALAGQTARNVGTATHYHADYVVPRWAYTLAKVETVGRHIFYRFPDRWGAAAALTAPWLPGENIPLIDRDRLLAHGETEEPPEAVEAVSVVAPHVTDRHAATDIGGRLDPSKEWRLTIPDPVVAGRSYSHSLEQQGRAIPLSAPADL